MDRVRNHSYQGYDHEKLVEMLDSASPVTVQDKHATHWQKASDALLQLAVALDQTVIDGHWSGSAAEEFRRRLTATAACARGAGNTSSRLANGLGYLANDIREAKRKMPSEPGKNLGPSAIGPDGAVAASAGYVQASAARKKAADKAEQVMADLGTSMQGTAEYWFPQEIPARPADMPQSMAVNDGLLHNTKGGGGSVAPPATGVGYHTPTHGPATGGVPSISVGPPQSPPGTELTGVAGPVTAGAGPLGVPGIAGGSPGVGSVGVGGGLGAAAPMPGIAVGSGLAGAAGPRGTPRLGGGAVTEQPIAGRAGNAMMGSSRGERVDEPEEHTTWLTEDDMVWRDEHQAPPSVIE